MSITRRLVIVTKEIDPPVLRAKMCWLAYASPFNPGDPRGFGTRESEAVMDLYEAIADREQVEEDEHESSIND